MTNPRINPTRELFGILGSVEKISDEMSWWNKQFAQKGMDAALSRYPTTADTLPERLSEMFHFDRRGYIVGKGLTEAIISLLDGLDASAIEKGSVDTVLNTNGVMTGYFCGNDRQKRWGIWLVTRSVSSDSC